jgi:hypothetical protein
MKRLPLLAIVVFALVAAPLLAQGNPTAKLSGRVSSDGEALPGVLVTVDSPALQGTRTAFTTTNGDYIFPSLPPGEYTVTFELAGFADSTRNVRLSAAQDTQLDTALSLETVTDEIVVTGELETISQGTQVAASYGSELVDELPVGRSIDEIVNIAPGVSATGPGKNGETGLSNIVIAGAPSYENLFLVNGVVVNENIRGQANDLFIEDAIQETTTATAGISAEYGRFAGGVVNVITKSGGNDFSGSLRTSLANQDWEAETPLTTTQTDETIPTYELTLGGPILRDRLWFFLAGRTFDQTQTSNTSLTNLPYQTGREEDRYEGKLTWGVTDAHTLIGSYMEIDEVQLGTSFGTILDLESLYDRETPEELLAVNYSGILTPNLFATAQYSERAFTFVGSGGQSRDLIDGTLILDRSTGSSRYHAPTFCGVCPDEERNNENLLAKLSYFLSTDALGSHDIVVGYDTFTDIRQADNHQSGSDFRIFGTSAIIQDGDVFPIFTNDGSTFIQWNPILESSRGTDFVTNSYFVNDSWRFNDRLSFNIGVRYDENDGRDSSGQLVAADSKISPRLAATWDPWGEGEWVFHGSYGQYVAAIANGVANDGSSAGSPATLRYFYRGPNINTGGGPLVTSSEALEILFDWFQSVGFTDNTADRFLTFIPGGSTRIDGSLDSPHAIEYTLGLSKRFGSRGLVRADVVRRDFDDFYFSRTDLTTGQVQTSNGPADLTLIQNDDGSLERTYDALLTQFRWRLGDNLDLGGNWTWSHTRGNVDGETRNSGPVTGGAGDYPEYVDPAWNNPRGDLSTDLRHRVSIYGIYDLLSTDLQSLSVGLLQSYSSGRAYEEQGTIRTGAFVANPGYISPPTRVTYFFSDRGGLRTPDIYRTDLTLNYGLRFRGAEVFVQPEVLNVFNEQRIDTTDSRYFDSTVLTADNGATCPNAGPGGGAGPCQTFNPFTQDPVEGVHYVRGDDFGTATNPLGYQLPRTFQISLGVRF